MHRIKSVGVMSVAKIFGLCYAAIGLLLVPFFLLFGLIGVLAGRQTGAPGALAPAAGVALAVLMPFFYGALGFIFGVVAAFAYNIFAGWIGGIELELQLPEAPLPAALVTNP